MSGGRLWKAGRRGLNGLAVAVVIVIALMTLWWRAISRVPDIKVPSPVLPVPNAHDDYIAAGQVIVNSSKLDYAPMTVHTSANPDDHPYTLAQKETLIVQNAPALRLLRKGLGETYWAPPVRSFNTLMPYYARFRALARLLALEQQTRAQAGDWRGAMDSGLDGIQMGVQIPHGGLLIGDLVGIACEAIARRPMWDTIDHLSGPEARAATRRLQGILAQRFPYSRTMQEEKWAALAGLLEAFKHKHWQRDLLTAVNGTSDGPNALRELGVSLYIMVRGGPRTILTNYSRYMDQMIARANLPYGVHAPMPPLATDPVNQMLAPVFTQADFKDAATRVEDDLLLLTLTLRAYRVEHGRYPDTLQALMPNYLTAVPQDLFAKSGTLHYRLKGNSYLLYSVGPDGVDNGGTAIDDPTRSTPPTYYSRHRVDLQSLGDIVAGVNQ